MRAKVANLEERIARLESLAAPEQARVASPPQPRPPVADHQSTGVAPPPAPPPAVYPPVQPPPPAAPPFQPGYANRVEPSASFEPSAVQAAAPPEALEAQMGLRWVNRIGSLTLILAALFVFKYAADNDWIGPGLRIMLGLATGLGAVALAERLWRTSHATVAQGIAGLGVGIVYGSLFVAYDWYGLLPQLATFGLLAAVAMGAAVLALRFQSQGLAVLAALGALMAPPILASGSSQVWQLNAYLLLVAAGSLHLAKIRPWPVQAWVVYVIAKLFFWQSILDDSASTAGNPGLILGAAFYALYLFAPSRTMVALAQVSFAASLLAASGLAHASVWTWQVLTAVVAGVAVSEWRRDALNASVAMVTAHLIIIVTLIAHLTSSSQEIIPRDLTGLLVITAVWALFAIWIPWGWLRRDDAVTPVACGLFAANSIAFALAAVLHFQGNAWNQVAILLFALGGLHLAVAAIPGTEGPFVRVPQLRVMAQVVGIFLVAWAIPLQFSGVVITSLWALLAAALAWISREQRRWWLDGGALLLFGLAWLYFLGIDLPATPSGALAFGHPAFFGGLLCALAGFTAAYAWRDRMLTWVPYVIAHLFLLGSLTHEIWLLSKWLAGDGGSTLWETANLSILLSVYAATLVAAGIATSSRPNRLAGLVMLLCVVLKLYLYDVWLLDTLFRILAFGALGTMLLGTSFLYSRLKNTVRQLIAVEGGGSGSPPSDAPPPSSPAGMSS